MKAFKEYPSGQSQSLNETERQEFLTELFNRAKKTKTYPKRLKINSEDLQHLKTDFGAMDLAFRSPRQDVSNTIFSKLSNDDFEEFEKLVDAELTVDEAALPLLHQSNQTIDLTVRAMDRLLGNTVPLHKRDGKYFLILDAFGIDCEVFLDESKMSRFEVENEHGFLYGDARWSIKTSELITVKVAKR